MDSTGIAARRLGQARAMAAGVVAAITALTVWGTLTPTTADPGPGMLTTAGSRAFADTLGGALIWGFAVGVGTFAVVWLAWTRLVEWRRLGDRTRAPGRPRERWAWYVSFTVWTLILWVFHPFDTIFPPGQFSTDTGAWAVVPANVARWITIGFAGWVLPEIAWRWIIEAGAQASAVDPASDPARPA